MKIEELKSVEEHLEELAGLLIEVVDGGAAVGFMPPMQQADARSYWEGVPAPDVILLVAKIAGQIAGTVQLHLCMKQNGAHRAEIAKLMTHPRFRRNGVARALLQQAEERARQEGRSLLVLDTREGDPSNLLYASFGFQEAGRIPGYARSANGELHGTVIYYRSFELGQGPS